MIRTYFAFGSNLDRQQMRRRCPDARLLGPAVLPKHRLIFCGHSHRWRGAVANVTRDETGSVPGLLYKLTNADLASLDAHEGHPNFYRRQLRLVTLPKGQRRRVQVYIRPPSDGEGGTPGWTYLWTIWNAYAHYNFDLRALRLAAWGPDDEDDHDTAPQRNLA